jgi:hypothetical protein
MKRNLSVVLILLITLSIKTQSIYEPVEADINNFLDRMNIIGIIQVDVEVKPFTRDYIAQKLFQLKKKVIELNPVEREELEWYQSEYDYELSKLLNPSMISPATKNALNSHLSIQRTAESPRWRLFSYTDSLFQLQLSPILGFGFKWIGKENGYLHTIGIRAIGSYGNSFSSYIHFTDNGEYEGIEKINSFLSPVKGRQTINAQRASGIEYSDVRGAVTYDWNWGQISLLKDYFSWGYGYSGNVIFSSKAPSYPHLRLILKPIDWFRFYFTHGWLTSNVVDSLKSQYNYGYFDTDAQVFVPKYFSANLFVFKIIDEIDFMLGNSVVYSGDYIRPEFFIPFMFFKYLDRDLGKGNVEDANGQLHFGVNYKPVNNIFIYGNILFDVIEINKTLEGDNPDNWNGYTIGTKLVNSPIENLDFTLEYTRINPWVYEHKDTTTTYKHLDYTLGHWIGQNADLLRVQLDYKFMRPLQFSVYFQRFRKGGIKDISQAYGGDDSEEFLYGPLRKENTVGINIKYNPFHEVQLTADYRYTDITDEDPLRTPAFQLGSNHNFSIFLSYGFR